jgi:hypothetical protein
MAAATYPDRGSLFCRMRFLGAGTSDFAALALADRALLASS